MPANAIWRAKAAREQIEGTGRAAGRFAAIQRPIFASTFYPALKQPNVTLVPKAVARVTPTGIVDADGVELTGGIGRLGRAAGHAGHRVTRLFWGAP